MKKKQTPKDALVHKEILALYRRECKQCGHLDPDEPKTYDKCHYTKGNDQCPASEVQIAVVGRATRLAMKVLKCRRARDAAGEAKILATVSKENVAFQSRFYTQLESGGVQE